MSNKRIFTINKVCSGDLRTERRKKRPRENISHFARSFLLLLARALSRSSLTFSLELCFKVKISLSLAKRKRTWETFPCRHLSITSKKKTRHWSFSLTQKNFPTFLFPRFNNLIIFDRIFIRIDFVLLLLLIFVPQLHGKTGIFTSAARFAAFKALKSRKYRRNIFLFPFAEMYEKHNIFLIIGWFTITLEISSPTRARSHPRATWRPIARSLVKIAFFFSSSLLISI